MEGIDHSSGFQIKFAKHFSEEYFFLNTAKLGYNEQQWDQPILSFITGICFNQDGLCRKHRFGTENVKNICSL